MNLIRILLFLFASGLLYAQDTIYVASEPNYPPFCIVNENGEADGFSVDLFKETAAVMGLKVIFKVDTWNIIKEELANGGIDALPMVGRSREREEIYDFTFPYYVLHGAVFVRKGTSEINTLEDLKVKDILVMKGDNAEEYVLRENISSNVISTDNYETAFRLLESGGYDTVIAQELMGLHLLNILGIDNIIPLELDLPGFSQDFSFAVHNGNTNLLAKLNEGLAIVIANGRYDEIHKKWLVPIEKQAPITFKELLKVLIYVIPTILILISLIAILVLRFEVKRRTKALKKEVSVRKQAEQAIEQQLSEKEIILKEVHHRIKNNFTTIGNLLSLQANSIENPDANFILQDAISRVNSMSILYEKLLLEDEYMTTTVKNYLTNLIDEIIKLSSGEREIAVEKQIEDFQLTPKKLFPLGLIVNELLTNIMKYAFTDRDSGIIEITLKEDQGNVILFIQDNGIGLPEGFDISKSTGFGLTLVKMLSQQLQGNFTIKNNDGTISTLEFII